MSEQPGLGDAVRVAREAAGLTLEQVSASTKIRPAVLRDFEAGSSARSGGAAYARGHLRAIARVTGADPVALLAAHDRTVGGASVAATGAPAALPADTGVPAPLRARIGALSLPSPARERGGPRWGVAGAAAAAVLSVLLLVGVLRDGKHVEPFGAIAPAAPATPAASATPPPAPVGAALRLEVTGGASWVDVLTAGGTTLFRGVLGAGAAREFSDPSPLSVTVGNAGAVTVGCAGDAVPAGRPGQVRHYTCASGGLAPA